MAPTMPVLAAINAPTRMTVSANPPGAAPNKPDRLVNNSLAISVFSRSTPIKTKRGTAIRVWLVTIPKRRPGRNPKSLGLNAPIAIPKKANNSEAPPKVKATG